MFIDPAGGRRSRRRCARSWLSALAQAASVLLYIVLLDRDARVPLSLPKIVMENVVVAVTIALLCSLALLTWRGHASGLMAQAPGWRDVCRLAARTVLPGLSLFLVPEHPDRDSLVGQTSTPGRIAA